MWQNSRVDPDLLVHFSVRFEEFKNKPKNVDWRQSAVTLYILLADAYQKDTAFFSFTLALGRLMLNEFPDSSDVLYAIIKFTPKNHHALEHLVENARYLEKQANKKQGLHNTE